MSAPLHNTNILLASQQFSTWPWLGAANPSLHVQQLRFAKAFLFVMGWAVILFELVFPLALLDPVALKLALLCAAGFHFSNACFFGLNRFFWIWLCAYPALIWFQDRIF